LQPQVYNFPSREEENSYTEVASEKANVLHRESTVCAL